MLVPQREPRETGRDYALRAIKENIIQLELKPGSMVSENELAGELGLSRTPVREALIELSKVRIIEVYPQKGSAVSYIDYALIEEADFLRRTLETAIMRGVCEKATDAELQELGENVMLQQFYVEQNMPAKLWELDNAFHKRMFEICNKMQLYILMKGITVHLDRVRVASLESVDGMRLVKDHRHIVEALLTRDPAKAEHAVNVHLDRYKYDEDGIRKLHPEYFK